MKKMLVQKPESESLGKMRLMYECEILKISPPFSSTSSGSFYLHDFSQGCIETGDGTARFPSQRLRRARMFELFYIKFTHL